MDSGPDWRFRADWGFLLTDHILPVLYPACQYKNDTNLQNDVDGRIEIMYPVGVLDGRNYGRRHSKERQENL
jgi:hypothetical protein